MRRSGFSLMLIFLVLWTDRITAQQTPLQTKDSLDSYIDISKISLSESLRGKLTYNYIKPATSLVKEFPTLIFNDGASIHKDLVPDNYVTKKLILRFNLRNTADTITTVWFYPGYYYWDIKL